MTKSKHACVETIRCSKDNVTYTFDMSTDGFTNVVRVWVIYWDKVRHQSVSIPVTSRGRVYAGPCVIVQHHTASMNKWVHYEGDAIDNFAEWVFAVLNNYVNPTDDNNNEKYSVGSEDDWLCLKCQHKNVVSFTRQDVVNLVADSVSISVKCAVCNAQHKLNLEEWKIGTLYLPEGKVNNAS